MVTREWQQTAFWMRMRTERPPDTMDISKALFQGDQVKYELKCTGPGVGYFSLTYFRTLISEKEKRDYFLTTPPDFPKASLLSSNEESIYSAGPLLMGEKYD